jgi:hypothetical protein
MAHKGSASGSEFGRLFVRNVNNLRLLSKHLSEPLGLALTHPLRDLHPGLGTLGITLAGIHVGEKLRHLLGMDSMSTFEHSRHCLNLAGSWRRVVI